MKTYALLVLIILGTLFSCKEDSSTIKAMKLSGDWEVGLFTIDAKDVTDSLTVLQLDYRFIISPESPDTYSLEIVSADSSHYADMVAGNDDKMYIYHTSFQNNTIPGYGALTQPSGSWDLLKLTSSQFIISIVFVDGRRHEVTFDKI